MSTKKSPPRAEHAGTGVESASAPTYTNTWPRSKTLGDRAELAVAEYFRRRGADVFKAVGRADVDLILQSAIEIKRDAAAERTGLAAIETHYRDRPSGIMRTRAAWWIHVIGRHAFIIKTRTLCELLEREHFAMVRGGDGGRATLVLVPVKRLREVAAVIDLVEFDHEVQHDGAA